MPFEFTRAGRVYRMLPTRASTNHSDDAEVVRLGFGLAQDLRDRFASDLASGALVEVLPDNPPSPTVLSALSRRTVSSRLASECSSTGLPGFFRG